ncbi:uncharacterized protein LOC108682105 [Hyalella azteca]|uniref:Uncharacterized protein LOC108682105 n=1 Tax=Hyalella azteca TaxID=294128 RepID=A0A8B7PL36_HYAAZ|nr:uncharacterized protein LOC108682105 [Hyalella azteca]
MTAVASVMFTLVSGGVLSLWTLSDYEADTAMRALCHLVVDEAVAGAIFRNALVAYRRAPLRDDLHIFEYPKLVSREVGVLRQACLDKGMELPPVPRSPLEKAMLAIRVSSKAFMDVVRLANGTYVTWSTGVVVPSADLTWAPHFPEVDGQDGSNRVYINSGSSLLYDTSKMFEKTELLCVAKIN